MILGITGGTGCGKTTLLELLRERGGKVLDCDKIYHRLLQSDRSLLSALERRFPQAFPQGKLERKLLGRLVFSSPAALTDLNQLTHRAVRREVLRELESAPPLAAIDAIALFESGLDRLCDVTVAVTAPLEERVTRIMARDGITEEYARSRIAAQPDEEWFRRRCDFLLENDSSREEFQKKCVAFLDARGIIASGQQPPPEQAENIL